MVVSSRKQQSVDEAVAQLRGEGHNVAGTACHVGDPAALQRLVQFALDTYGSGIDILVSNAAVNPAAGPILDMEVRAGWVSRCKRGAVVRCARLRLLLSLCRAAG